MLNSSLYIHLPHFDWSWLVSHETENRFPNLVALIEQGASGCTHSIGNETLISGIFSTGYEPNISGIITPFKRRKDGLGVTEIQRYHIKKDFIWETLAKAGFTCAAINFQGTHGSTTTNCTVVSDKFANIYHSAAHDWPVPLNSVYPEQELLKYRDYRWHPDMFDPDEFLPELGIDAANFTADISQQLCNILCNHSTFHNVAVGLLNEVSKQFLSIRYSALSDIHQKLETTPTEHSADILLKIAQVIDLSIGRLLASLHTNANIVVTGGGPRPFIIAKSNDVAPDTLLPSKTALIDVAPTLLAMFGIKDINLKGTPISPQTTKLKVMKQEACDNKNIIFPFSPSSVIPTLQAQDETKHWALKESLALLEYNCLSENKEEVEALLKTIKKDSLAKHHLILLKALKIAI